MGLRIWLNSHHHREAPAMALLKLPEGLTMSELKRHWVFSVLQSRQFDDYTESSL